MELVKNIFFNTDRLTPNSVIKISYTGDFFQNNSEEVYIHYGFGLLWEGVNELKMSKTELGFQAEIKLGDFDSFNFCFRNEKNEWDNNNGNNYIFPIEKLETSLVNISNNEIKLSSPRKLRKTYLWSKKLKLALYKIIVYVPKLISGNYKRKLNNNNV